VFFFYTPVEWQLESTTLPSSGGCFAAFNDVQLERWLISAGDRSLTALAGSARLASIFQWLVLPTILWQLVESQLAVSRSIGCEMVVWCDSWGES
jgi:hypothetical protein